MHKNDLGVTMKFQNPRPWIKIARAKVCLFGLYENGILKSNLRLYTKCSKK